MENPGQFRVEINKLIVEIEKMRPLGQVLSAEIAKREAELKGVVENAAVRWEELARDLSTDASLSHIAAVWDNDRDSRYHDQPEALARLLLLRELDRRPRRANSVETMGLASLRFRRIESLGSADVPDPLRERNVKAGEWRDYLYFLVDSVLRANFVLRIDPGDARWLLPRQAVARHVVGPEALRAARSDQLWPVARAGGNRSNAVLALEQHFEWDSSSSHDRAKIDEVLRAAWDELRPMLGKTSTYALDLTTEAEIVFVHRAWLCPITRRVLPRLLWGRSPYALRNVPPGGEAAPQPITLPTLPCVFPRNAADRDQLSEFLASDPHVAALRQAGAWSNLSDRAAQQAWFLRAEEHSAQQPPDRLRAFERSFKAGEINLLACSTTMEMGVDIGSVEAVLNTNVPPSIANYRQRVGRAGRRRQAVASALTFAREGTLDQEAFNDPTAYLRREPPAPSVRLDSARIVLRHLCALLLARWLIEAGGQLLRLTTGGFFGHTIDPDQAQPAPLADRFRAWLTDPTSAGAVAQHFEELVAGTALAYVPLSQALADAATVFKTAADAFNLLWQGLADQIGSAQTGAARTALDYQMKRLCHEPLLSDLAHRSVLPGHGFPTDVLSLVTDCAENTRMRATSRDGTEEETPRGRRYGYPSRNAPVALRDYAPGSETVVDGLVWRAAGVTLNWRRPVTDAEARETQSLRWFVSCHRCGAADCLVIRPAECPTCGEVVEPMQFLSPAGFRVDWNDRARADAEHVQTVASEPVHVAARGADWQPLLDTRVGRGRCSDRGIVFHQVRGAQRGGYRVCLQCGRAAEGLDGLQDHDALVPARGATRRCVGNDHSFLLTAPLALGHDVLTDVVELQWDGLGPSDAPAAWAFGSALREALAKRLAVQSRELGLMVARRRGALGGDALSIFLYDEATGGAGYAPRAFDDVAALLAGAHDTLNCPQRCTGGCSACVLQPDLAAMDTAMDREGALALVIRLRDLAGAPAPADLAFAGATLGRPTADALVRLIRSQARIDIWTGDDLDLSALETPLLAGLFHAARTGGATVRLVLPTDLPPRLDDAARRGLRAAEARHQLRIGIGDRTHAPNGARLLAVIEGEGLRASWFTRDPAAAELGPDWGIGGQHPVVKVDQFNHVPAIADLPTEALDPRAIPGPQLRELTALMYPAHDFGTKLLTQHLQPALEAAGLWRTGLLGSISYSDRYLHAPLPMLLLLQTAAALKQALATQDSPDLPVHVATQTLRDGGGRGSPSRLEQDWPREADRRETTAALAATLRLALRMRSGAAPHQRRMELRFTDGVRAVLLFDQGFGCWRAIGNDRHNFNASGAQQAEALLGLTSGISCTPSFLIVTSG